MKNVNPNIAQTVHIIEDDFSLEIAESFDLSILISNKELSFAVIEPTQYRVVQLESYTFDSELNVDQLIPVLENIFNENNTLQNSFWKTIKIGLTHNKSTLIPETLFDEENVLKYFQINCSFNDSQEKILIHLHKNAEIVNLFSIDHSLYNFLNAYYSTKKIEFVHLGSLLIEGLLHYNDNSNEPTIYIHLGQDLASFMMKNNSNISYYNSFHIKDFKDLLYYTLFIAEEFNIAQEQLRTIIWGNTGLENEYVDLLKDYINSVSLGNRPKGVSAGYKFSDIANHQYFELLAMPLV